MSNLSMTITKSRHSNYNTWDFNCMALCFLSTTRSWNQAWGRSPWQICCSIIFKLSNMFGMLNLFVCKYQTYIINNDNRQKESQQVLAFHLSYMLWFRPRRCLRSLRKLANFSTTCLELSAVWPVATHVWVSYGLGT